MLEAKLSSMVEGPKFRLLLADDSSDNRLVIMTFLKRLSFEIEIAENGSVAVEKFAGGVMTWF